MRLYGKKFLRKAVDKRVDRSTETRDSILWYIDEAEHTCRVKIQGSSELITATYPKNWRTRPRWLKTGSAVRITHRSGVRGYVEVVGEGRAIPSPIEGDTTPPIDPLADGIVSGMNLVPTDPESNTLGITQGTYRIGGTTYAYLGGTLFIMGTHEAELGNMGTDVPMGISVEDVQIDPAPAEGYFRYDGFAICSDGQVQYLKGTAATSEPVKPDVPGSCVLIDDYILVVGGVDTVGPEDIGRQWEAEYAAYMIVDYSTQNMNWATTSAYAYARVKDQYGWDQKLPSDKNTVRVQFLLGTGTVRVNGTDLVEGEETSFSLGYSTSVSIQYSRDQLGIERIPNLMVTAENGLSAYVIFFLFDEYGDPLF